MKQAGTSCVLMVLHLSSPRKWLARRRQEPHVGTERLVVRDGQVLDKRCRRPDSKVVRVHCVCDLVDVEGGHYVCLDGCCIGGFFKRIVLHG